MAEWGNYWRVCERIAAHWQEELVRAGASNMQQKVPVQQVKPWWFFRSL